jgi:hypothetical protein
MSKLSKRLQPTIVKSTKTQSTLCLSGADIIELLCEAGVDVPSGASVTFRVPSGGDWSGESIDIDAGHTITVDWERTS